MALSIYGECLERAAKEAQAYRESDARQIYGWFEGREILGVCGFTLHGDKIVITSIAVAESHRKSGIGKAMIASVREKYALPIEAETDDDAVHFYQKCGFETTAFQKYGGRRWSCTLK